MYTLQDYPLLVKEWHSARNGVVHPVHVSYGSGVRFWWRCAADATHEWRATANARTAGKSGCPFCAGRKASPTNNLRAVAPWLAAEWHPEKNGTRGPDEVVAGTTRPAWWKCPHGDDHEWMAAPHDRLQSKGGCPFCLGKRVSRDNSLATCAPELAREWHPTKNGRRTPEDTVVGSSYAAWWRCPADPAHEWRATVDNRHRAGTHCPACWRASGRRLPTLATQPRTSEGTFGYSARTPRPCRW